MRTSVMIGLTARWATAVLAACIAGCGSDTLPHVDRDPPIDFGPTPIDLGPLDGGQPDLGPPPDMGPRCAPRVSGDTQWPQYPIPGTAGHPRSYQVRGRTGSETVIDCVTGLEWERAVDPGMFTQPGAVAYCDGLTLGGYTDWRLPWRIELVTLVDYSVAGPGPTIDASAFPGTPPSQFWAASIYGLAPPNAWSVGFMLGDVGNGGAIYTNRVRCVRSGG